MLAILNPAEIVFIPGMVLCSTVTKSVSRGKAFDTTPSSPGQIIVKLTPTEISPLANSISVLAARSDPILRPVIQSNLTFSAISDRYVKNPNSGKA